MYHGLNNHVINANGDPIAATYKLELLGAAGNSNSHCCYNYEVCIKDFMETMVFCI